MNGEQLLSDPKVYERVVMLLEAIAANQPPVTEIILVKTAVHEVVKEAA